MTHDAIADIDTKFSVAEDKFSAMKQKLNDLKTYQQILIKDDEKSQKDKFSEETRQAFEDELRETKFKLQNWINNLRY